MKTPLSTATGQSKVSLLVVQNADIKFIEKKNIQYTKTLNTKSVIVKIYLIPMWQEKKKGEKVKYI